jgi:hypothetical protein
MVRKIYLGLKQRLPAAEWRAIRGQLDPAISQLSDPARSSEHPGAVLNVVSILTQNETSRETFAARLRAPLAWKVRRSLRASACTRPYRRCRTCGASWRWSPPCSASACCSTKT